MLAASRSSNRRSDGFDAKQVRVPAKYPDALLQQQQCEDFVVRQMGDDCHCYTTPKSGSWPEMQHCNFPVQNSGIYKNAFGSVGNTACPRTTTVKRGAEFSLN
jgi:hypothetical protein